MMRNVGRAWLLIGALLVVASGCSGSDSAETTTTTLPAASVSTQPPAPATTAATTLPATVETTEPPLPLGIPEYRIVRRQLGDAGDTVVVLLDPASYNELTDLDLQNVVGDVVEQFPPIFEAHVVDSLDAVDAVLAPEPTEEQVAALEEHYFVRFEEGFRMVFMGQFSSVQDVILGS